MAEGREEAGTGIGGSIDLMRRAMEGDRAAFVELQAVAESEGSRPDHYYANWTSAVVMFRLQDRASEENLLARAGIEHDVHRVESDLAEPGDGPIERLIIGREALCSADSSLAERDYQCHVGRGGVATETLERRRERSQRMLLAAFKTLVEVRRMNWATVQVNIGDGNVNVVKA